jgi:hypothetical protein
MADDLVKFEPANHELARALEGLSVNQALAMNCIMAGGTMIAAAHAAGVDRRTLYEWLQPGTPLHEAVTIWKQDLATTARTRLLMMTDLATKNILAALQRGDVRTAMTLVQKIGVLSAPPIGPTHVEAVTEHVTTKSREQQANQTRQDDAADFVDQWTEMSETHEFKTRIKKTEKAGNSRTTRRKNGKVRRHKSGNRNHPVPQTLDPAENSQAS